VISIFVPTDRDEDDAESRGVGAVADVGVGFEARGFQLRDEAVDASYFEADVIDRAAIRRRLQLVHLAKGDFGARDIRDVPAPALPATRRSAVRTTAAPASRRLLEDECDSS